MVSLPGPVTHRHCEAQRAVAIQALDRRVAALLAMTTTHYHCEPHTTHRHCEARRAVAIQCVSSPRYSDCHVASLLAMTSIVVAPSQRLPHRFAPRNDNHPPSLRGPQGRGNPMREIATSLTLHAKTVKLPQSYSPHHAPFAAHSAPWPAPRPCACRVAWSVCRKCARPHWARSKRLPRQ